MVIELLADHTELFKQFSDNAAFKKWLADVNFSATYRRRRRSNAISSSGSQTMSKGREISSTPIESYESGELYNLPDDWSSGGGIQRRVEVLLPPDWKSGTKFPVIYMNDGDTAFRAEGISPHYWRVQHTLAFLYREEMIPHVIVVAVKPNNRWRDYLHGTEFCSLLAKDGGGLPEYMQYLTGLKDYIDRTFPTYPDRERTTIVGSSHGGLAAFWTAVTHGDYFGKGEPCRLRFGLVAFLTFVRVP